MKDRLILTFVHGEQFAAMHRLRLPFLERYANKTWSDLRVVRDPTPQPRVMNQFAKLQLTKLDLMRGALEEYERVVWLDGDVLVRPDCPNLFDLVKPSQWAAYDECAPAMERGLMAQVKAVHDHMVRVCGLEGLPVPESHQQYFNCGVQAASRSHAFLYETPRRPDDHGWCEQSLVNVRLFVNGNVDVFHLPEALNMMFWMKRMYHRRTAWIVHYCGLPYHERLQAMAADVQAWGHLLE